MNTNAWIQSEKEGDLPFPAKNVLCNSFAESHLQELLHSLLCVSYSMHLPFLREKVETGGFSYFCGLHLMNCCILQKSNCVLDAFLSVFLFF